MEHITTMDAVNFVVSCKEGFVTHLSLILVFLLIFHAQILLLAWLLGFVGATVTPQHLLLNRNALFQGGLQPHNYCLPVLKREIHRMLFTSPLASSRFPVSISAFWRSLCFYFISTGEAIVKAVTSGSKKFFLGTDSAPHERRRKESSCGCAGIYSAPVALSLYAKVFDEVTSNGFLLFPVWSFL